MTTGTTVAICLTALLTSSRYALIDAQQGTSGDGQTTPYTFHVAKSEVAVDVIAVDAQNHPVLDLVPADLEVFDEVEGQPKALKAISSLRIVDTSSTSSDHDLPQPDLFGLVHGSCMFSYTVHYQLAYSPGIVGSIPGIHTVQLQAKRRGVKLLYRHGYLISPSQGDSPPAVVATLQSSETPVNTTLQVGHDATLVAWGDNSFGSSVPSAVSLCADVYEIPEKTKRLPDFRHLNPIGVVYTDFLSVSREADVIGMGFPDITTRAEWVGLDYYGRIWIAHPGAYKFQMVSDDGALLEIDGKRVIDLDGIHPGKTGSGEITLAAGPHTVHLPYFNATRAAVLMLYVEAPGETTTLFNTRRFTPPRTALQ
jgi:hypothetical protein